MNVVFMGTPEFACPPLQALADSHHNLVAVVTAPDKPAGRGHRLTACQVKLTAMHLDVPLFQPENLRDPDFIDAIKAVEADVFVVIAFRILPKKLYSIPSRGAINIHGSLLPKYRGAAPVQHALLNGETETGLTSFFLKKQVDQGDMIHQVSTEIYPDENYTSLAGRLAHLSARFLLETLEKIEQPGFTPMVQDDSRATPAPKIYPEQGRIDWIRPGHDIHNLIRAFSEKPGAFTFMNGMQIKILGSSMGVPESVPELDPGKLFYINKQLFVGTGDTPLRLTTVQPQGKRAIDAPSFVNGYRITNETTFTQEGKEVIQ